MRLVVTPPPRLGAWTGLVGPEGRRELFSVAANAVAILVRRHLSRIAAIRHGSAKRLGATPTGHFEKGARATHFTASADGADVMIPIAGLRRAFGPLTVTPRRASLLTLPISAHSYGKRVGELRANGWRIFRPKGRDFLMGRLRKGDEAVPLYALRRRANLRQDRSLLPSDAEIGGAARDAMSACIRAVAERRVP